MKYIDRHNALTRDPCGGEDRVLAGFHLTVPKSKGDHITSWWGETKYEIWCRKAPYKLKCKKKYTKVQNTGNEYIQALASHDLDCNKGFIKGFTFDKNVYTKTSFDYWCCGPHWMTDADLKTFLKL